MAGIAIALDLLRKNPSLYTAHSSGFLSATAVASAAAASVAAGTPFAYKALFGYLSFSPFLYFPIFMDVIVNSYNTVFDIVLLCYWFMICFSL